MRIVSAAVIALAAHVFGCDAVALCQVARNFAKRSGVANIRGCSCASVFSRFASVGCVVVSPGCTSALPGTTLNATSPGFIQPTLQWSAPVFSLCKSST